jgi:hypothetical protein
MKTSERWAAILAELDSKQAPDTRYRDVFSSFTRIKLSKGQTWRDRLVAAIASLQEMGQ